MVYGESTFSNLRVRLPISLIPLKILSCISEFVCMNMDAICFEYLDERGTDSSVYGQSTSYNANSPGQYLTNTGINGIYVWVRMCVHACECVCDFFNISMYVAHNP